MALEIERKWIVECPPSSWPKTAQVYMISQTYLRDEQAPGTNWRARMKLGTGDNTAFEEYTSTTKVPVEEGVAEETERINKREEYHHFRHHFVDPSRRTIDKVRTVFEHGGRTFEFDHFLGNLSGLYILELEGSRVGEPVDLPRWISVQREVTGDVAYSNWSLALRT